MGFSCYIEQLFFVCLYVLYHGFIETKNIQKLLKNKINQKKEGIKVLPLLLKGLKRAILAIKKVVPDQKTSGTTFKIKKQEKTILRNVSKD